MRTLLLRSLVAGVLLVAASPADARPVAEAASPAGDPAPAAEMRASSEAAPLDVLAAPPAAPRLVMWPLTGRISSPFGARPGGFHNGIDIAAPMYTPVRAAQSGIVLTVGTPYLSYGDTAALVVIGHAANFSTLYAHLDDEAHPPTVRPGQRVEAGQVIGYVGMTGWTTGPHCHFMTVYDGRQLDPLDFLP